MERWVLGIEASYKNILAGLTALAFFCGLLPTTPVNAQGGLVACMTIYDSVWSSYYSYDFGSSSTTGQVSLTDGSVFPYGDGQYGKLSFDLRGFGEDVFSVSTVQLYSVHFRANPDVLVNQDVYTFVTPYSNGVAGRVTQHGWVANILSSAREWTDTYSELPQADSFSVAMFMPGASDGSDFFAVTEVCVRPVNIPTNTPPASATLRATRTPTITRTPTATRTRTATPPGFTPSVTTTPVDTNTPGGPTATPNSTEGTPLPVLGSGAWVPIDKPSTCGEDDLNPCGALPFPPASFPTLAIASPSGIPTLTPYGTSTPGATGTGTPTVSWEGQGDAMATLAQSGGAGGYTMFTAANQIGGSIGYTFGMFNALQSLNLGRIGVLLAFIIMILLFIVFVRIATFVLRILLFILKQVRLVV